MKSKFQKLGVVVLLIIGICFFANAVQAKSLTIAYIQPGPFVYYDNSATGVRLAGEVADIDVVVLNSDFKPEQELANIETALTMGVDGIILFSLSTDAARQAIKKATSAGVPIHMIYGFDKQLEDKIMGFIQSDGFKSGLLVGQWLAANLKSGKIACIQGALGRGDAENYTAGFKKGIEENSALTYVADEAADWNPGKAYTAMENLITSYPDLAGIFVQNEPMAIAASKALKVQGKQDQVLIVSQNGSPEGILAVDMGVISATSGWSPSKES
jgi:ribose transport system substrate-binding protein